MKELIIAFLYLARENNIELVIDAEDKKIYQVIMVGETRQLKSITEPNEPLVTHYAESRIITLEALKSDTKAGFSGLFSGSERIEYRLQSEKEAGQKQEKSDPKAGIIAPGVADIPRENGSFAGNMKDIFVRFEDVIEKCFINSSQSKSHVKTSEMYYEGLKVAKDGNLIALKEFLRKAEGRLSAIKNSHATNQKIKDKEERKRRMKKHMFVFATVVVFLFWIIVVPMLIPEEDRVIDVENWTYESIDSAVNEYKSFHGCQIYQYSKDIIDSVLLGTSVNVSAEKVINKLSKEKKIKLIKNR